MYDSVERTDNDTSPTRRLQAHSPSDAGGRVAPARPARRHSPRTRVAMLEATVAALQFERDCLQRRVDDLEGRCRTLRSNVETLETKLDAKEQQRKQIVQTYERILTDRDDCQPSTTHQEPTESSAEADDSGEHDSRTDESADRTLLSLSLFGALLGTGNRIR
jgi:TolA-binding protein